MDQLQLRREAAFLAQRILESNEGDEYFPAPFQHLVIDTAFSAELADICLSRFPDEDDPCWVKSNLPGIEIKSRTNWASEFDVPEGIIDVIRILNSALLLRAMSSRFGIPKLMPDPYFTGGGLNCTSAGGMLDVHVDGNYHDASGMHRRMNAILYLNPNYDRSWGGEFGIYSNNGQDLVKAVEPIHNRLVIFDSHDKSYHGLPNPIRFPKGSPRRSIILYYYTASPRPSSTVVVDEPHSALWQSRGFTDKHGSRTRDFT